MSFGFGFGLPSWRTLAGGFSPAALFVGGVQGAWYDPSDLSTLFDSSTGTTPVAMPGQGAAVPVGLMLDKSQNGVGTNGAYRYNLLTYTEQFNNAAWVKDGSTAANTTATTDPLGGNTADVLTATLALYAYTYQPTPVSTITATFSCYVKAATASVFWLYYESSVLNGVAYFGTDLTTQVVAGSSQTPSNLTITSVGNGWFRISAQWSTVAGSKNFGVGISDAKGSPAITIGRAGYIWGAQVASAAAPTAYQRIDANWYSTLPGNHAISFNNTTARPVLMARVNLLEYSEQFNNAYWSISNLTVNATNAIAPDGTATAYNVASSGVSSCNISRDNISAVVIGSSITLSVFAKAGTANIFRIGHVSSLAAGVWFNLSTGQKLTEKSGVSGTITPVGNGWYKCTSTLIATSNTSFTYFFGPSDADNSTAAPPAGQNAYFWGADLRPANIGANVPAYQRIADALTYDTNGFPLYLRFDGIDDSMYTPANLNLSGTDKVAVFAGVRQQSTSTVTGQITEFSSDVGNNNGAFGLAWPAVTDANTLRFQTKGTTFVGINDATATSPSTAVISLQSNISAPSIIGRRNGTQVASSVSSLGTGNFGTYPLFIGARNNASNWFNGHLYSLVVAGSAVSAGNISATEQWVAGRTGIQI